MSIDRIYREFFGFSLIILSLFLFVSLLTFSAQDNIFNAFDSSKVYLNNFGYLGALFSSISLSYIGYSSYYLTLIFFYFGMVLFFSSSSKDLSERLNFINHILFAFISIFPLSLFLMSFVDSSTHQVAILEISSGGIAGENLALITSNYLPYVWVGSISAVLFLTLQYFIFYDFLNFVNTIISKDKKKIATKPKNMLKKLKSPMSQNLLLRKSHLNQKLKKKLSKKISLICLIRKLMIPVMLQKIT